jgi:uncharacterized protein YjbI with pentapeptide repeats
MTASAQHSQVVQPETWTKLKPDVPSRILDDSPKAHLSGADLHGSSLHRANLRGAELSGANLSRAGLSWANLRGAELSGANLSMADLSWADLREADLRGADLRGANLRWASLFGANLQGANFSKADLTEAHLGKTLLCETDFGAAYLRDAKGLAECKFEGPCILDMRAIQQSGLLPVPFLRGCGLPDSFIEYLPSLLNQAVQRFSCCISYSIGDKAFAKRLFDTLEGRDIRCWLNEKRAIPGDAFLDQVDRAIRIWDKTLLCCSKDSLSSWWVDNEIDSAFEKEQKLSKERGQTLALIPLDLDGYLLSGQWQSGKAEQMCSRMVADFRGWKGRQEAFESEVQRVILALRVNGEGASAKPKPKPRRGRKSSSSSAQG